MLAAPNLANIALPVLKELAVFSKIIEVDS